MPHQSMIQYNQDDFCQEFLDEEQMLHLNICQPFASFQFENNYMPNYSMWKHNQDATME